MSGKPAGSCTLVMAADGCFSEPIRDRRLAEARGPIKVPLRYHQDRRWPRFLEGCPANHAVLLPAQILGVRFLCRALVALSPLVASYVRSVRGPGNPRTGILWP